MRILAPVLFVGSSIVVGLAAQAPTAGDQQPPAAARAATKVTIGGCIQNAPVASAAGAPVEVSAATFVLANAKRLAGAAPAGKSAGASGAAPTARYRLDGEEKMVAAHLNHQVEITGVVQAVLTSPGMAAPAAGPVLRVESVKMVADKCS